MKIAFSRSLHHFAGYGKKVSAKIERQGLAQQHPHERCRADCDIKKRLYIYSS
jgi:hypothetical protein